MNKGEAVKSNGGGSGEDGDRRLNNGRTLNKRSYKINKQTNNNQNPSVDFGQSQNKPVNYAPLVTQESEDDDDSQDSENQHPQLPLPLPPPPPQHHHQPPVYNIHKNDFRAVVQRLTGLPVVEQQQQHQQQQQQPQLRNYNMAGMVNAPRPSSSRLQRIRPPPLAHFANRPPPQMNIIGNHIQNHNAMMHINIAAANFSGFMLRGMAPMGSMEPQSPLPAFPGVPNTAAESPVSAYMRFVQNDSSGGFGFANPSLQPPQQQAPQAEQQNNNNQSEGPKPPTSAAAQASEPPQFQMPASPLPFGCLNSPVSGYPLLSPSLLHSPTPGGQFAFPLSPVASPKWKGI
ncbi:hypothetical protein ACFE04_013993 [Oxalis oulophora]